MVWDKNRLEQLRADFANANGGEIFDEKFRKVAEKIISKNGTRLNRRLPGREFAIAMA
ncbi:hypothetical protein FHT70_001796 [Rhizobium sp. BK049]|nr:hypothetical protein [Rhizobium sp. BK049]